MILLTAQSRSWVHGLSGSGVAHFLSFEMGAIMQYRVQFLGRSDNVIRELQADARSTGFPLLMARPPHATRVRVIYPTEYVSTSTVLATA